MVGRCRFAAFELRVVIRTQRLVGERLVGLGELRGLDRRDLLEFLPKMLNLIGMVFRDLAAEGALDLIHGRRGDDVQHLVVGLHNVRSLLSIS